MDSVLSVFSVIAGAAQTLPAARCAGDSGKKRAELSRGPPMGFAQAGRAGTKKVTTAGFLRVSRPGRSNVSDGWLVFGVMTCRLRRLARPTVAGDADALHDADRTDRADAALCSNRHRR
jgi:hypothetical protein